MPPASMPPKKKKLGEVLVEIGFIDKLQLRAALAQQAQWGKPLGRTLVEMRLITEEQLIGVLKKHLNLPAVDLSTVEIDPSAVAFLDEAYCRTHECIPFAYQEQGKFLDVAMSEVQNQAFHDELRVRTRCNVRPFLAGTDAVIDAIERAFGEKLSEMELQFKLSESLFDFGDEAEETRHVDPAVRQENRLELDTAQQPRAPMSSPTGPAYPAARPPRKTSTQPAVPSSAGLAAVSNPTGPSYPAVGVGSPSLELPDRPQDEERLQSLEKLLVATMAKVERQEGLLQQLLEELRHILGQLSELNLIELSPQRSLFARSDRLPLPAPGTPGPAAPPSASAPPSAREASAPAAVPERPRPHRTTAQELPSVAAQTGPAHPAPRRSTTSTNPAVRGMRVVEKRRTPLPDEERPVHASTSPPPSPRRRALPEEVAITSLPEAGVLVEAPRCPSPDTVRPSLIPDSTAADPELPILDLPADAPCTVAIDLGTTRSSIAAVVNGRLAVLKLPGGGWDIPSVVGFREDGSVIVGKRARQMLATDPANVIASPKRLLGRRFDEPALGPYLAQLGMKASAGSKGDIVLHSRGRQLTVTEACSHLLTLLHRVAERTLGRSVRDVILTVPVSASERQLRALGAAAAQTGLQVVEYLHEPVAAAMSCIFDPACQGLVAIYDFGGGTFDFSVVELGGETMQVVASSGDSWLGGDDLDVALASAAANAFWQSTKVELRNQAHHWQQLLLSAELAKRELSAREQTVLRLPNPIEGQAGGDFEYPVDRRQFARLIRGIVDRSLETCQEALASAGLTSQRLSAVYLSGGTSYVPAVQAAVAEFFGQQPRAVIPPERMVVVGAAVHGALMGAAQG